MDDLCDALQTLGVASDREMETPKAVAGEGLRPGSGGRSAVAVGEVRRLNIVYFLCRDGVVEQPHLIRLHHFYGNGVHLQDVKRWLADLRGKDMPESYSWSYKRRYRTGYVWQDLMDDDLITPIADNEYVLKGSLVTSNSSQTFGSPSRRSFNQPLLLDSASCEKKKVQSKEGEQRQVQMTLPLKSPRRRTPETLQIGHEDDEVSPKPPPSLDEDSPPGESESHEERPSDQETDVSIGGGGSRRLFEMDFSNSRQDRRASSATDGKRCIGRSNSGRSSSGRLSIRSLLSCRALDAVEAAQRPVVRRETEEDGGDDANKQTLPSNNFRRSWSGIGGKSSKKEGGKVGPSQTSAIKQAGEPNCPQCGKSFNPDKLRSHIEICKPLRARVVKSNSSSMLEKKTAKKNTHRQETTASNSSSQDFDTSAFFLSLRR